MVRRVLSQKRGKGKSRTPNQFLFFYEKKMKRIIRTPLSRNLDDNQCHLVVKFKAARYTGRFSPLIAVPLLKQSVNGPHMILVLCTISAKQLFRRIFLEEISKFRFAQKQEKDREDKKRCRKRPQSHQLSFRKYLAIKTHHLNVHCS